MKDISPINIAAVNQSKGMTVIRKIRAAIALHFVINSLAITIMLLH